MSPQLNCAYMVWAWVCAVTRIHYVPQLNGQQCLRLADRQRITAGQHARYCKNFQKFFSKKNIDNMSIFFSILPVTSLDHIGISNQRQIDCSLFCLNKQHKNIPRWITLIIIIHNYFLLMTSSWWKEKCRCVPGCYPISLIICVRFRSNLRCFD